MQVRVETGRGFSRVICAAFRDDYSKQSIGRIIMDASFSPVRRVAYSVSAARVAQRTDFYNFIRSKSIVLSAPEDALKSALFISCRMLLSSARLRRN